VGVEAVGVGDDELLEGLFPVGGGLAFDESSSGSAWGFGASFFGSVSGSSVFDVADGEPQQFHVL